MQANGAELCALSATDLRDFSARMAPITHDIETRRALSVLERRRDVEGLGEIFFSVLVCFPYTSRRAHFASEIKSSMTILR